MKTLIVIDVQNDFVSGTLGTKEAKSIVPNIKKKIEEYRTRGDEVIFTRDTHYNNYLDTHEGKKLPVPHCIYNTYGWQVSEDIEDTECKHIDKYTFGYTGWSSFNFEELEIVGLCTDICVVSNALILRALFPEIEITVDASCCAGVTSASHRAALLTMKSCQINIIGE